MKSEFGSYISTIKLLFAQVLNWRKEQVKQNHRFLLRAFKCFKYNFPSRRAAAIVREFLPIMEQKKVSESYTIHASKPSNLLFHYPDCCNAVKYNPRLVSKTTMNHSTISRIFFLGFGFVIEVFSTIRFLYILSVPIWSTTKYIMSQAIIVEIKPLE